MSNFEYYLNAFIQGWKNVGWAFRAWGRYITSNYRDYDYFDNWTQEEKEENVRFDFWDSLEDDIYPKYFLDHLSELVAEIDNGTMITVPWEQLDEVE